jgi:acyl-coenzyme A thioesterase PaaI-like protein
MIEIPSTERRRTVTWHDPAALAAARTMDGLTFLRAVADGTLPPPPAAELIEMRITHVEPGVVRFTMPVREYAYSLVLHGPAA